MLFAASAPRPDCPVASAAGVRELLGDLLLSPVTPTCRLPGRFPEAAGVGRPRSQPQEVLPRSRRLGDAAWQSHPCPSPRDSVAQTTADSLGVGPSRV